MKTYSILSYNRTGSTIVGQCLASYFGLEYQAEITNIADVLMRYDETGKDVNVFYKTPLPQGTYAKTYDICNNRVERILNYNNPKPFIIDSKEYQEEVSKRIQLLKYNKNSKYKSIFKIQPQKYVLHFKDPKILDGYNFIFCARRDIKKQIISYLIAMETKIFHIGYIDQTLDISPITVTKKRFDHCLEGLKQTNQLFEYYKENNQIEKIIYYEDWEDDVNKILPLLGFEHTSAKTFKKIKYTVGSKFKLVKNLEEVYDWMNNEPEFNYTYSF